MSEISETKQYLRPLTAQEMIDEFGVEKDLAYFIKAIENGEIEGDVIIVPDDE